MSTDHLPTRRWATADASARRIVNARARAYSREDREDLVQDVLAKLASAFSDDTWPDNLDAWLETVTGRAVIDLGRARARRPSTVTDSDVDDLLTSLQGDQFASLEPLRRKLLASICELVRSEYAAVIGLRYVEDFTSAQVAAALNLSVGAVDQRLCRARQALKEALAIRPDLVEELRFGGSGLFDMHLGVA
jgi:RNA polymerase sigma factor (sigma-70 family)